MLPWTQRPLEANLFNPAYCAVLLRQAVEGYQKTALRGLDYAAAFMVLPVVLHQATRELLPGTIATKLHFWAQRHHEVRIGFAKRMQDLVPITKEALLFGLQHEATQLNGVGTLVVGPRRLKAYDIAPESEVAACLNRLCLIICAAGPTTLTSLTPVYIISHSLTEG